MDSGIFNLNVFTNVASDNPEHCLAHHAIRSFYEAFPDNADQKIITRIYIDPSPNPNVYEAWLDTIRNGLPDVSFEIVQTKGLIPGFTESLRRSEGAYALQLEHDFVFLKDRILHSLGDILSRMERSKINFLRFNKRTNEPAAYDYAIHPAGESDFPLCRVNGRSNNPHILELGYYRRETLAMLDAPDGSTIGLEGGLCRYFGGGHVYGGLGHPRTVQHLDGRRLRFKDAIRRNMFMLKQSLQARAGFG